MSTGSSARVPDETRAIEAWLSSMSDRTRALLEFHFEHDARHAFVLAPSAESADVVIVDYDYPGARAAFESGRWRDGPPLMLLAHGAPAVDGALVLAKPLDRSSLDAAAARLRSRPAGTRPSGSIGTASTATPAGAVTASPATLDPDARPEPPLLRLASGPLGSSSANPVAAIGRPRDRRARARVSALCGPPRSLLDLADNVDPEHRYDPTRHLSGHLGDALAGLAAPGSTARGLMLAFPDIELYVLPWLDRIFTSEPLTWQIGIDRAFRELDDADVTRVPYGAATINTLVARVNAGAAQSFPTAAFRWLAALFSARGRLPYGVDIEEPLALAHWPNLSRLELTPACMAIVAEWTARPCSIATMVERVGCEPCHVTALHAALTEGGLLHPAALAGDLLMEDGNDDAT